MNDWYGLVCCLRAVLQPMRIFVAALVVLAGLASGGVIEDWNELVTNKIKEYHLHTNVSRAASQNDTGMFLRECVSEVEGIIRCHSIQLQHCMKPKDCNWFLCGCFGAAEWEPRAGEDAQGAADGWCSLK